MAFLGKPGLGVVMDAWLSTIFNHTEKIRSSLLGSLHCGALKVRSLNDIIMRRFSYVQFLYYRDFAPLVLFERAGN